MHTFIDPKNIVAKSYIKLVQFAVEKSHLWGFWINLPGKHNICCVNVWEMAPTGRVFQILRSWTKDERTTGVPRGVMVRLWALCISPRIRGRWPVQIPGWLHRWKPQNKNNDGIRIDNSRKGVKLSKINYERTTTPRTTTTTTIIAMTVIMEKRRGRSAVDLRHSTVKCRPVEDGQIRGIVIMIMQSSWFNKTLNILY